MAIKMFIVFCLMTLMVVLKAQQDCYINGVLIPNGQLYDEASCTQCSCDESGGPACKRIECEGVCPDGSLPQPVDGLCCPICPDSFESEEEPVAP